MKKIIAFALALVLALSMAVTCSAEGWESFAGGWTVNADARGENAAAQHALQVAQASKLGAEYTFTALLATQVVNGINYAMLCEITPVVPGAPKTHALVYVHENFDGTAEILDIQDLCAPNQGELGGWTSFDGDAKYLGAARQALKLAVYTVIGAKYEIIDLVSTQLVSGINYRAVCAITPVTPGAVPTYAMITIHESMSGTCSITDIQDIEFGIM